MKQIGKHAWKLLLALCVGISVAGAVGCAPRSSDGKASADTGSEAQPASVEFTWSKDSDCAMCHETESEAMGHPTTDDEGKALVCSSCHADEVGLATAHEGATADSDAPKRLSKTKVSNECCQSCHESADELVALTASSTALTDSQGKTANPHEFPNELHPDIVCADCHNAHETDPVEETAKKTCLGCHHADVYECYTCHE